MVNTKRCVRSLALVFAHADKFLHGKALGTGNTTTIFVQGGIN